MLAETVPSAAKEFPHLIGKNGESPLFPIPQQEIL